MMALASFKTKSEKPKALKAQLIFRNHVLNQQPTNKQDKLYAFSKNKTRGVSCELKTKQNKLVVEALEDKPGSSSGHVSTGSEPLLVGKCIRYRKHTPSVAGILLTICWWDFALHLLLELSTSCAKWFEHNIVLLKFCKPVVAGFLLTINWWDFAHHLLLDWAFYVLQELTTPLSFFLWFHHC